MHFLIIILFSSFIVNLIIQGLHIYTLTSFILFIITLLSSKLSYEKIIKKTISWNPFINIKNKLIRYNIPGFFLIVWIMFYLGIFTICIFVLPGHPSIYGVTMTEILPFYVITEPIVRFLLIQTPISGLIWICFNIRFLYIKFFTKKI